MVSEKSLDEERMAVDALPAIKTYPHGVLSKPASHPGVFLFELRNEADNRIDLNVLKDTVSPRIHLLEPDECDERAVHHAGLALPY